MADINLNLTTGGLVQPTPIATQPIIPVSELGKPQGPTPSEVFTQTYEDRARVAEMNNRRIEAEQRMRKLKADAKINTAPMGLQIALERRIKNGGNVPYAADGSPNWDRIQADDDRVSRMMLTQYETAAAMVGAEKFNVVQRDPETGKHYQIFYIHYPGSDKPPQEMYRVQVDPEGAGGKGSLTAQQALDLRDVTNSQENLLRELDEAYSIVNDPNKNVVGPGIGAWWGRAYAFIESFAGHPERRNDQRKLTILLAGTALNKANQMKGPLTEKELGFLLKSQPQVGDDEQVWKDWLKTTKASTEAAHAEKILILQAQAADPNYDPYDRANMATRKAQLEAQGHKVDDLSGAVGDYVLNFIQKHPEDAKKEGLSVVNGEVVLTQMPKPITSTPGQDAALGNAPVTSTTSTFSFTNPPRQSVGTRLDPKITGGVR
jgi:hypothetical protein